MRKIFLIAFVLSFAVLVCFTHGYRERNDKNSGEEIAVSVTYKTLNYDDMKAIWLSQYDMQSVYTENGRQRDRDDFLLKIDKILDNIVSLGMNTVIVQVRPFGDSMYPSELYPMSSFVTGEYGISSEYDPFGMILEKAHDKGLSVHAWINPLRGMTENETKKVPDSFKIREWFDKGEILKSVSGRVYLDPAYSEARELIVGGAVEIVKLYDVDGVHMDDYFYPTTDESFDAESYEAYRRRGGAEELAEFRRDNVNTLIREIYSALKSEKEDVLFGISPAGSMKYNYNKLYADVYEWCGNEGYIDYICPQIYFGFEHDTCDFKKLCREFSDMIKCDEIRLIIGMTLGKAVSETDTYAGDGKDEWKDSKDILKKELEYTMKLSKCSGVAYFCYQYFFDSLTGEEISAAAEERQNLIPLLKNATRK